MYQKINIQEQHTLPVHAGKHAERIVAFANQGLNMSDAWWKKTHRLSINGNLWGIYKTPSGLRRNTN